MTRTLESVAKKVEALKDAARERDQRQRDVRDVRSGDIDTVVPGSMPDPWPRPVVANMVDLAARDTSEVMGQMPSINCTNSLMTSDRSKKFSSKRTRAAAHIVLESRLQAGEQIKLADHYLTYGMGVYVVEPDFERHMPIIRVESPMGAYPEFDVFGCLRSYSRCWREQAITLVAQYPHIRSAIVKTDGYGKEDPSWSNRDIEVCKYMDKEIMYMYLPEHGDMLLVDPMPNPFGEIPISPAVRPSFDGEIRGAYDDAIWVYLAKSRMAMLGLEAAEKSVRAPIAVPRDLQRMVFGSDSILRTDNPEKIRRVGVDMPQYAVQEEQVLEREMRMATRSPQARSGNVDASIITGKGVEALMGGFDTVVTTGQQVIGQALKRALEISFRMYEKFWPDEKQTIRGLVQGTPFEDSFTAAKDINGNYTVDVSYGFAAGQDPARAIVALLQLRGDQLVSRDFVQRQLPMEVDVAQMQVQIDQEQMSDALKQGVQAAMAAIPQMALQGMDPIQPLTQMAELMKMRERGVPIQDAVLKAFTPKEAPQGPQNPLEAMMGGSPQGGPAGAPGAPQGAPQGQDVMQMLASLKGGGQANMNVRTRREQPI
jgi:hypothetical protein